MKSSGSTISGGCAVAESAVSSARTANSSVRIRIPISRQREVDALQLLEPPVFADHVDRVRTGCLAERRVLDRIDQLITIEALLRADAFFRCLEDRNGVDMHPEAGSKFDVERLIRQSRVVDRLRAGGLGVPLETRAVRFLQWWQVPHVLERLMFVRFDLHIPRRVLVAIELDVGFGASAPVLG